MKTINSSLKRFFSNIIEVESRNDDAYLCYKNFIKFLPALNLEKGSIFLIALPNGKIFLEIFFAILNSGYVPTLVAPSTPNVRINLIAEDFNAKAIIKYNIVHGSLANISEVIKFNALSVTTFINDSEIITNSHEVILTTSGTSGFSSGCVFDYESLICNAKKHAQAINLTKNDNILVNLPLYYSYAFVAQALAALVTGSKLVISGPPFSVHSYIENIKRFNISVSSITPILVKEVINSSMKIPDCLRTMTIGGDQLNPELIQHLVNKLEKKEVYITYGLTEAGPRVATLAAHNASYEQLSSVGLPLNNISIYINKNNQNDKEGELLIHSSTMLKKRIGCSKKPLFQEINNKLWLKTGDIFSLGSDGFLYFKSRISDFIVLKGEKVNLAAIRGYAEKVFNAAYAKTKIISNLGNISGFDLEISIIKENSSNYNDNYKTFLKGLKIFEKPSNIIVSVLEDNEVNLHK